MLETFSRPENNLFCEGSTVSEALRSALRIEKHSNLMPREFSRLHTILYLFLGTFWGLLKCSGLTSPPACDLGAESKNNR